VHRVLLSHTHVSRDKGQTYSKQGDSSAMLLLRILLQHAIGNCSGGLISDVSGHGPIRHARPQYRPSSGLRKAFPNS
jgi:hypothetical protein